ncbi:MAG: EAL domain-containing protein [Sulfurimonas sp.]|uniref:EAL domain-containing protein n=1 Tax=Sulfurimonas sp. TaxID=2022749 RepID=UPI0026346A2F|nr:EAL domain-containing protein [Sulfurimonas sp.]MCW8895874.1 EAL domain-containing protein [Sulfurimonas sp.]MCW8954947.1 EAL domain-containing protein [Sulfurimonas sp.]MCW9066969.1 EAL domain-containing protein [Sulfurimonas sp.]
MLEFDKCIDKLKNIYINGSDTKKNKIIKVLNKLSVDVADEDDLVLSLNGIDIITMLPNREALLSDLQVQKDESMLMFLHNNQMAALQELYGMEIVKKIIIDKAQKLENIVSNEEVSVYHINIQKFAILVKKKSLFDKYLSVLEYSIFNNIDDFMYKSDDGERIISDFTVGIAYGKDELFNHANIALQEAIVAKKKYNIFKSDEYSKEVSKAALQRLDVYKNALHSGSIVPYFQPIFDIENNSILKYEALARIITQDGEVVTPDKFLTSAIEDKTFEFFTRQMMQKVFNIYDKTHVEISINITYENINSADMLGYIKNRLDKYGGDRITFEIVETQEIQDYNVLKDFIVMVKMYGAKVSIDDFGSGYSNFTNIIRLNIDFIKIDGTLIQELFEDAKVRHMVEGLIKYSKNINVKTIAEFVSSKELSDEVKRMGVDYVQGYHHGKPKSAKFYGLE